jgi:glycosyltransferase involved in cell wall biosynthesis
MPGGRLANFFEKKLDRWLTSKADHLVTISEPMAEYYKGFSNKVEVIMNGYDAETLENARACSVNTLSDKTVIRYMGIVSPGRVPYNLMRALQKLKTECPSKFDKIRVEFYGNASVLETVIKTDFLDLNEIFFFFESVSYFDSLRLMTEADYLLFSETSKTSSLSSQGILTTKLFEYIGSGRPVLADISPTTLAGSLLLSINGNHVISISDDEFYLHLSNKEFYIRKPDNVSSISKSLTRESQTHHYLKLMKDVALNRNSNL